MVNTTASPAGQEAFKCILIRAFTWEDLCLLSSLFLSSFFGFAISTYHHVYRVQMLDKLPRTVFGVGMQLLGSHAPLDSDLHSNPGKRDRLAILLGIIIVVRTAISWRRWKAF